MHAFTLQFADNVDAASAEATAEVFCRLLFPEGWLCLV